jgi:imidazoleglycerol-phosphate dehydratase
MIEDTLPSAAATQDSAVDRPGAPGAADTGTDSEIEPTQAGTAGPVAGSPEDLGHPPPLAQPVAGVRSPRQAVVERATKESTVRIEVDLDGQGRTDVSTGVPFYDHMLEAFGKHAGLDLRVRCSGDIEVDTHHSVEDTALALGEAIKKALGDKAGIRRFGDATVPLDEALVTAVVDLSGRPYLVHQEPRLPDLIGTFDTTLVRHVFESLVATSAMTLHVRVLEGRNAHHIVESEFKAVARALRQAVEADPRVAGVPSTKGVL